MAQTFVVVVTGTMAAVGAAAIPARGCHHADGPAGRGPEPVRLDIALVVTMDWFLDGLRRW